MKGEKRAVMQMWCVNEHTHRVLLEGGDEESRESRRNTCCTWLDIHTLLGKSVSLKFSRGPLFASDVVLAAWLNGEGQ